MENIVISNSRVNHNVKQISLISICGFIVCLLTLVCSFNFASNIINTINGCYQLFLISYMVRNQSIINRNQYIVLILIIFLSNIALCTSSTIYNSMNSTTCGGCDSPLDWSV